MQISIGNGETTVLTDKWLPTTPSRAPRLLPYTNPTLPVKTFIDPTSHQWDIELLQDMVDQSDIHPIRKLFIPPFPVQDGVFWPYTRDGNYTVKSGYHFITTNNQPTVTPPPLASHPELSKKIWSSPIPPKLKHFFWRIGSRILAIKENLRHRHILVDPFCVRCCDVEETSIHTFFTCPFSQQVWHLSGVSSTLLNSTDSLETKLTAIFYYASNNNLPN